MHIALLAGEISGDKLGGALLAALKEYFPTARFSGVGGEMMTAAGLKSHFPLERLSVMGLVEVLLHLPDLLAAKKSLLQMWQNDPPDLFIGIDAPDFTLPIAAELHHRGIKTVHYVSPSLWAWKEKRIHKIARAVDLMLCLFPFETAIYQQHHVKAVCVGHPLRDRLKPIAKQIARQKLGLPLTAPILGIFPGSRKSEIERLLPIFLASFTKLQSQMPSVQGLLSTLHPKITPALPPAVSTSEEDSALLMSAADVLLLASGTITLEAALLARPLVSAYRVNPLTAAIARRLLKIDRFALPNLLAQKDLVPECIQENCHPSYITNALVPLFSSPAAEQQLQGLAAVSEMLPCNVSARAAQAIVELLAAG